MRIEDMTMGREPLLPPVRTIADKLRIYGPSQCPACGERRKIYLRTGDDLVCLECGLTTQEVDDDQDRPVRLRDSRRTASRIP